jgi:hypothetical protein
MKLKKIHFLIFTLIFFLFTNSQTGSFSKEDSASLQKRTKHHTQQHNVPQKVRMMMEKKDAFSRMRTSTIAHTSSSSNVDLVNFWGYGMCWGSGLDMSRSLAFVGNGYVMQILDVSTPSLPSLLGEVTLSQEPTDIAILGNYAYVLTMNMLFVVDITDPTNPIETGSEIIPDQGMITPWGIEVAVTTGYAYAAVGELGCIIFNVTDPANPNIIDTITNYGWGIYSAAVSGNYLYLSYPSMYVYDITTPSSPTYLGSYGSYVDYNEVADGTASGIAYTCGNNSWDEEGVFDIIDFSGDPSNPTFLGGYTNTDWYINDFSVNGNTVYLSESDGLWSTGQQRLDILDITTPSSPTSIGDCTVQYPSIRSLDVSGDYIGMAHYQDGFSLYDVSSPASPSEVAHYDTPDAFPLGGKPIVLSGDYAYLANRDDGLRILDVSTPSDPSEVGRCETVNAQGGIAVVGKYVYGVDNAGSMSPFHRVQ